MKTKTILSAIVALLFTGSIFAQDRTTVTATSNDISDNLDLRAVASIFGDSKDLADFERRLNDPKAQISNLDLNGDQMVDYLRVIESVEGKAHIIIVQAVLEKDIFQDVATIEVERDSNNVVQVQVVGDVYMYGDNYVYQPVYVSRPFIYDYFWTVGYRPYWSSWYWGYYPSYYYAWNCAPIYRYRRHIHNHINVHNHYVYASNPRPRNYSLGSRYRGNGYAVNNPGRSFRERNTNVSNRYELAQVRNNEVRTNPRVATTGTRGNNGVRSNNTGTRNNNTTDTPRTGTRSQSTGTRTQTSGTRSYDTRTDAQPTTVTTESPRSASPRVETQSTPRASASPRTESASPRQASTSYETPRAQTQAPRAESPRVQSQPRSESPRMSAPQSSSPRSSGQSSGSSRGESRSGGRR